MAELADARDLKSRGKRFPYRFDPGLEHHVRAGSMSLALFFYKNQRLLIPPLFLIRKRSRSRRLFACKRAHAAGSIQKLAIAHTAFSPRNRGQSACRFRFAKSSGGRTHIPSAVKARRHRSATNFSRGVCCAAFRR